MDGSTRDAITGAYGFTGRSIARRLLASGRRIVTLTNHPREDSSLGGPVDVAPLDFEDTARLSASLRGVDTLYNTYWIRFARGDMTFDRAVENSRRLISAAREAGVRRMVHVSIANPSSDSPLPYYRGKAMVEQAIEESGLSYAILRPAALFGDKGILVNNIAWFLRRLPVFGVPGDGKYGFQPIFVEDLAELAVAEGSRDRNCVVDAAGPETYSFDELLKLIARAVRRHPLIVHLPPELALLATGGMGAALGDVVLTRDEVRGLMANLLVSHQPPTGHTPLSVWLAENASWLGTRYMSEVNRHYK